ncbi:hypothetical protein N7494_001211 [Penicillium frequentans]|uniref:Glycine zipper 2TM domain-containing protein n=1 Tax=Penicillium frequentans TaxID=3151616 RepID=A0AAD6GKI6_9EURO|nr:hypothetical protein N7494_001211 [Penicillium glabrum]
MSNYTAPPNSYEPYHGQAQGQAYQPHQESTVPHQEHYQYSPAGKCSGENASYYTAVPQDQANGVNTGPSVGPEGEGERGLGSTLLGGAAGGYAGHKMQGGFLGTAGGAVLGAVGMNMVSHEIGMRRRGGMLSSMGLGMGLDLEKDMGIQKGMGICIMSMGMGVDVAEDGA